MAVGSSWRCSQFEDDRVYDKHRLFRYMHVEQCLFINCAPFDKLHINFIEKGVTALSAINGGGKTTILSHIADAFHEIAKLFYTQSYHGVETQYYRIQSATEIYRNSSYYLVYIRFKHSGRNFDYINIWGNIDENEYENVVSIENKITFDALRDGVVRGMGIKRVFGLSAEEANFIFKQNIATYFPSYRFEKPQYLNSPYQTKVSFNTKMTFNLELPNPVEVISCINNIAEWLLDVFLDNTMEFSHNTKDNPIPQILNHALSIASAVAKTNADEVQFNIGPRNSGAIRLGMIKRDKSWVYPSIFNMSSGEKAIFSIFMEILRQADVIRTVSNIQGIVLIDEIDKHLHIKLQYEVLPKLIHLFPNIQFILSSHSPFLHSGLEDFQKVPYQVIDLDNGGNIVPKPDNPLYKEIYIMMIKDNQNFADKCKQLEDKLTTSERTILLTEGKTDVIHILKAQEKLLINDLDFFTLPTASSPNGDGDLDAILKNLARIPRPNHIIGIFDRDSNICKKIELAGEFFSYGNNVFGVCIPLPEFRKNQNQTSISIEYLYTDDEIKQDVGNGTRLYFGNEFKRSGRHITDSSLSLSMPKGRTEYKIIENNGGQAVYDADDNNKLAKKADFAEAVRAERITISDSSWQNYLPLFKTIRLITKQDNSCKANGK